MAARLRTIDCSAPGIQRRRRGKGFEYIGADGQRVTDEETFERIRALAIPPAWEDVWICTHPNGHLQATGMDAAGRKQYRYHEHWRERKDAEKFEKMLDFARALPSMRRAVARDLRRNDYSREHVLACALRLLDRGFFRIGSEEYAEKNESYGLVTIRKEHVHVNGREITFDYPAKSNKDQKQSITDPDIRDVICALKRRKGGSPELLAFRNNGSWVDVVSTDVNAYVKKVSGGEFTAKDFRTWNATLIAAVALAVMAEANMSATARKRKINDAVKGVAFFLGNTPTVARNSYIDPRVFDRFRSGWTVGGALNGDPEKMFTGPIQKRAKLERAVLDLLEERESSPALEKVA